MLREDCGRIDDSMDCEDRSCNAVPGGNGIVWEESDGKYASDVTGHGGVVYERYIEVVEMLTASVGLVTGPLFFACEDGGGIPYEAIAGPSDSVGPFRDGARECIPCWG